MRKLNITVSLLLLSTIALFSSSSILSYESFAQFDFNVSKSRHMNIDLGKGVMTNTQLNFPIIGKGSFPGVLLIHGSGPTDMEGTLSLNSKPLGEISNYLSERGFAVLKYDKRGIGQYGEIKDKNLWKNITVNDLIRDAEKALSVLIQQPEVDPKKISIIGHSEGAIITTKIAVDNPTIVQNIVLMSVSAQSLIDILKYQMIENPIAYAHKVLDKDTNNELSISEIVNDNFLKYILLTIHYPQQNDTQSVTQALGKLFENSIVNSGYSLHIENQIQPILVESFNNVSDSDRTECIMYICPIWLDSHRNLTSAFNVIGNVSSSINILLLHGENDAQIPLKQALMIKQILDDSKYSSHELKTYPNLGHVFYPSSMWQTKIGPIAPRVLADLYSWLESRSN